MTSVVAPDFRTAIADSIEASHELLAARWLDELKRVVPVAENEIFPRDVESTLGEGTTFMLELPSTPPA